MNCRHCATSLSDVFINLGDQPPSNSFLAKDELGQPEETFPLKVFICPKCFLVQVDEHKKSSEIFNRSYVYFSSFSSSWLEHARQYTEMAVNRFTLGGSSLVVEIASNDGYLLQYMKASGIPCYGVEPSMATADAAREKGIESITEFFTTALAKTLVAERGRVDLLIGNNVLAHVPDINDFVHGVKAVLKPTGAATLEFPHLLQLVSQCQFDTIYHEHFSYLSLGTVQRIFAKQGLRVFDVEELSTHGGSLRVFACHADDIRPTSPAVTRVLQCERDAGMNSLAYYTAFQEQADIRKQDLLDFLHTQKKAGKRLAAYGAAAKGNTLLNYCGVDSSLIEFCVDASPHKQGLFMPGSRIPVLSPQALRERKPSFILILPWNLKTEITAQHRYIREWGGTFVTAIPRLGIVTD
ncbi:MAG: class I SAM-dependent methyltransferase [Pseudodesulfovibrio sp.]|uniref:C-methyltransferase n=1 Tax=Pseudodesulfovibrio aespoeensis (strain ATCC 700646 / DSM 10631 / Aspo-2) TaxID=643562 RepID=E6VSB4_PSEA9|nr:MULTISPECIES: class I SAM-dependent methyltransferase [Pseudodesulfovibrio]MBU4378906.1 class I SAM-dependent methyltransferase [Pseudomonadota bacterium]ADU64257.1 C-methyltransferase [Pseudodesulfovibrio aespoeensis Aspo-2]MBU4516436.1 class I SAM-dependent methyltransferase [Pseudomonadota bacterium]MBU4523083.1 class I SAM-dependent methyltransferase [Pseudomonadota bacterium]MBU4558049.1 class I SAM-dependent methyltransferase [Pseudomonadota bacterium]